MEVTVLFTPDAIALYKFLFKVNYEFYNFETFINGIGGQALVKIDYPLPYLDFGVCRVGRIFKKALTIANTGNMGVEYKLRPEASEGGYEIYENENKQEQNPKWVQDLLSDGLKIQKPDAFSSPNGKTDIVFEYHPVLDVKFQKKFRLFIGSETEDIELRGSGAIPKLSIYNASGNREMLVGSDYKKGDKMHVLDLGVHSLQSEATRYLSIANEGPFGCDFLVQPISVPEFSVYPKRGYIAPGESCPLKIYFRPLTENSFSVVVKVLWEGSPIYFTVKGSGGLGKLDVMFLDEVDKLFGGIDFGQIPFNNPVEKRCHFYNDGLVAVKETAQVDHNEFTISQIGDPFPCDGGKLIKSKHVQSKLSSWGWSSSVKLYIPPGMGVIFGVKFFTSSKNVSPADIIIRYESNVLSVPIKGRGGTLILSHSGDLGFGDISSNYTYTRKITIKNEGSITTLLRPVWQIVGYSSEVPESTVKLVETYSTTDPRSGWARTQLIQQMNYKEDKIFKSSDYWDLIRLMIFKSARGNGDESAKPADAWDEVLLKVQKLLSEKPSGKKVGTSLLKFSSRNSFASRVIFSSKKNSFSKTEKKYR